MRTAIVFLSAVAAAWAQALTVNTPTGAINCLNQAISWVGGTAPYTIQIQPGGDVTAAALETFTPLTTSPYSWFVTEPANTQVFIRLRDSTGLTVESGTFTIRAGGTCPTGAVSSSSSVVAPPAGSSSAAPPAASSSAPPAGSSSTPAPGGSSSAGSGSTTASTTRATTSSTGAAGVSAKVAGGLFAVVGGAVALLA